MIRGWNLLFSSIFILLLHEIIIVSTKVINGNEIETEFIKDAFEVESVAEKAKQWMKVETNNVISELEYGLANAENQTTKSFTAIEVQFNNISQDINILAADIKKKIDLLDLNFGENCVCSGYTCGCCVHAKVPEIHLNTTLCVNITYLPSDYGFSFTIMLDSHVLFNETVSVRNPPPVCIAPPYVEKYADVCLSFYDINATKTSLHVCSKFELRLKNIIIAHYNLGCFDIGSQGVQDDMFIEVKLI